MAYYIKISGKAFGPLNVEKLSQLISSGKVNRNTEISTDKASWEPLDMYPELMGNSVGTQQNDMSPPLGNGYGSTDFQQPAGNGYVDNTQWYFSNDNTNMYGPYPSSAIINFINTNHIHAQTLIWREGDNRSCPISNVPEFASFFANGNGVPNNIQSVPPVGKQGITFFKNIPVAYAVPGVVLLVITMLLIITLLFNGISQNNIQSNKGSILKTLAKNAKKNVVAIKVVDDEGHVGSGTGVVIARDAKSVLILTNRHVVFEEGSTKPLQIFVSINDGEFVREATVVATPSIPVVDLSLVFVGDEKGLLQSQWKIASLESIEQGDSVYAIGHPLDYSFTITEGICSAKRNLVTHREIQHTAAINPGNSGGPLFDSSGNIVGINTYGINNTQGMFFALSADFVREQSQWTFYEKEEQTKLLLEKVRYVGN